MSSQVSRNFTRMLYHLETKTNVTIKATGRNTDSMTEKAKVYCHFEESQAQFEIVYPF